MTAATTGAIAVIGSSAQSVITTTAPLDCMYDVTPEELFTDEPIQYNDDVMAALTPEGAIKFTFPVPRDLSNVKLQAPDGVDLVVIPIYEDGTEGKPITLSSSPDNEISNPIQLPRKIIGVLIRRKDDNPIKPEDFTSLEVTACGYGKSLAINDSQLH